MSSKLQDWLDGPYAKATDRFPERREAFHRSSGEPLAPIYVNGDDDPLPGEYPYTRGIQPTMYRGRLWTMRQYAGQEDAEASNHRYRFLLDQGQTGLSVAFDLPTQIGYDSDAAMAEGEVGKVGVAIDSIEDMRTLFDQIPLDRVTTSMTINATANILLSLYAAVAEEQGVGRDKIGGTVQNDILKEYVARGTYIYPPQPSMRLITDSFDYCTREVPRWNTISISGYHMREAGCTAAQEIGFTLANAIAYVEAALDKGMAFDSFGPRLSFFFACHSNFLEEIGKFRAARRLWASIAKERFGSESQRAQMLRFHTQTGGVTLTAQQPDNNVIRTTLQALAAVLGGTQSLHTNSLDEALGLPSEHAVEIALRTQQVIGYESGVADVIDPLGGSYYVEQTTDALEAEARNYIDQIDALGGAVSAIEQGYQQAEILEASSQFQREVETESEAAREGDRTAGTSGRVIVGVNRFETDEESDVEIVRVDPSVRERQIEKLERLRDSRDASAVSASLDAIQQAASTDENLVPLMLDAVKRSATLGEISDALRSVWGEYQERIVV
ncbi:MAG: methylmalonyl-CoA mutase [Chloroflexi bacterium]|nr:methylmalonyl-CoA mutase [Chloroflexota bacterium]MYF81081.1 methylmalonyl-CoA mutase [Chloroflexota bacterium]MYI04265.1 methylmalonyl-CoA mutase [Chloroflexota bacterium]